MRKKYGKVGNKTARKKIQIELQKKKQTKQTNPNLGLCTCGKNKELLNYIQLAEKQFKKNLVQNAVFFPKNSLTATIASFHFYHQNPFRFSAFRF